MKKYELGRIDKTGLLSLDQSSLATEIYDSLRNSIKYFLPIGLAALVSGCANINVGQTIDNIITGGSGG